jgi:putative endonuclease
MKSPAVYMLASKRNGTLYIGVTSNLIQRIWQHREGLADGFTKQYGVKMLVWYEQHATMESAIAKEKAMKKWLRKWKLTTIEAMNPNWDDLWAQIIGENPTVMPDHSTPVIPPHPREDEKNAGILHPVIPAYAGIQYVTEKPLDSRLPPACARVTGNDESEESGL